VAKKLTISKLKRYAWEEFSRYIRRKECLETTGTLHYGTCVSCGQTKPYKSLDAGHFVPGRGGAILFDERGVHIQCVKCNRFMSGNWVPYEDWMREHYGKDVISELKINSKLPKKLERDELVEIRKKYKLLADELEENNE